MRFLAILMTLLLAACGGGSSGGGSVSYPTPGAGQWAVAFGAQNTVINGNSYVLPKAPGTHYVYTPAKGLGLGKTITLTYTLTETPGTVLTHDDPSDIDPPTISLFIWQAGDNLSCSGAYTNYRQFALGTGHANLQSGTNTITAVLQKPDWTGCYPANDTSAGFAAAVAGAAWMGFTLGGQYFAGHGIDVASGSATLTINSYTVH